MTSWCQNLLLPLPIILAKGKQRAKTQNGEYVGQPGTDPVHAADAVRWYHAPHRYLVAAFAVRCLARVANRFDSLSFEVEIKAAQARDARTYSFDTSGRMGAATESV
jgi:hypothetical protein